MKSHRIIAAAYMLIASLTLCGESVDIHVGCLDKEFGMLIGSRFDVYSSNFASVGPIWMPAAGMTVVGSKEPSPMLLGANIRASLYAVTEKNKRVLHRLKVDSQGVLVPEKTHAGGVRSRIIGGESLYVDAVANGVDSSSHFLQHGIESFCRPHGRSMQISANVMFDVDSGRYFQNASFVCEDGWVVVLFGMVGDEKVYAAEFIVRDGKVLNAKGSFRVCVANEDKMRVERNAGEDAVIGIWNNVSKETVVVLVCGESFAGSASVELQRSSIEKYVAELGR